MVASREHFFERGNSPKRFIDTVFEQGSHAEQAGLAANCLGRFAVKRHLTDGRIELKQFEDPKPASIPRVMAVVAAAPPHERGGR